MFDLIVQIGTILGLITAFSTVLRFMLPFLVKPNLEVHAYGERRLKLGADLNQQVLFSLVNKSKQNVLVDRLVFNFPFDFHPRPALDCERRCRSNVSLGHVVLTFEEHERPLPPNGTLFLWVISFRAPSETRIYRIPVTISSKTRIGVLSKFFEIKTDRIQTSVMIEVVREKIQRRWVPEKIRLEAT